MKHEYLVSDLRLAPGFCEEDLKKEAAKALGTESRDIQSIRMVRETVDARRKNAAHYVISCAVSLAGGIRPQHDMHLFDPPSYAFPYDQVHAVRRPVVVGSGPAGIFCALMLARAGACPIVIEGGADVAHRTRLVDHFFETGILDPETNVQFGEGGAGTFSDGKLNTGTRDARQQYVKEMYVRAGAPEQIIYSGKPHIGTDNLRTCAIRMREELESFGGEISFGTKLKDIEKNGERVIGAIIRTSGGSVEQIRTNHIILAPGNGARDTFALLHERGIQLEQKNFAVGVRIEHLQAEIDKAQYGMMADFKNLPAADYKVTWHTEGGRPVYSFCVCPGGEVVAAASDPGGVVTNGMSYSARDGININGALIVGVTRQDLPHDGPLAGIEFQRTLEDAAFQAGGGNFFAPIQTVAGFLNNEKRPIGRVKPTYRPGVSVCNLHGVLPDFVAQALLEALPAFGKRISGFDDPDAVLTAVETRTSSPVRIVRGNDFMTSLRGLYACGEGAGYAGGIMSSAVDGIRCAEKVCESF